MANTNRPWVDNIYLVYFILHIPIMFFVDLVSFYPTSLWATPNSPLSFLGDLRSFYLETYKDQFFLPPPAPVPSFFKLFGVLELVLHLPVSVWAVGALWKKGGLGGKGELLLLVYGLETALTTATCIYEGFLWDVELVSASEKMVLLGGMYGGYLAIAVLLSADMYMRLLNRLEVADKMKKTQ